MAVTIAEIQKLRHLTGAGMMDCKNALNETNGDIEAAIEIIRKKGQAVAAKRSDREASEGCVLAAAKADFAAIVALQCETDFVAKNEGFKAFVAEMLADAAGVADDGLAAATKAKLDAKIAEIGENIVARRNMTWTVQGTGAIAAYVHLGGKLGVMIEVGCNDAASIAKPEVKAMLADLTLHVTAVAPVCIRREEVPAETIAAESDIYRKQVEGKPANIIDKIVAGKLEKFYSQVCLLEQAFVKDQDKTVTQVLAETGKAVGDEFTVRRFVRWQLGA